MLKKMLVVIALLYSLSIHAQSNWKINSAYEISFSGKGADGTFEGLTGNIIFDENNLKESRFEITIDPSTIETGNTTKNKHARGNSWFDVKKYPVIKFKSTNILKTEEGYKTTGDLTLHGITLKTDINFTFKSTGNEGVFEGKLTVNRENFGIEGPFISFMVGDDFVVNLKVPVTKY